jgi:hypothetical protein
MSRESVVEEGGEGNQSSADDTRADVAHHSFRRSPDLSACFVQRVATKVSIRAEGVLLGGKEGWSAVLRGEG